ncbi:MAG: hypothetical protein J0H82_26465 [Alphaproteobacteria bacterium]|jgi:hypothetical protein|nr:hypothetical protein [Alphaproteobacteria bacterium]
MSPLDAMIIAVPATLCYALPPPRPWLLWLAWPAALLYAACAIGLQAVTQLAAIDRDAAMLLPAVHVLQTIAHAIGFAAAGLFCNLAGGDLAPWIRRFAGCGLLLVGWAAGCGAGLLGPAAGPWLRQAGLQ